MSADTSEAPQAVNTVFHKVFVQRLCMLSNGMFPKHPLRAAGVNFKAPKAARLLHARRLCDLRTTRFATIFTLVQFFSFRLAWSLSFNLLVT
jgi:hypothetical protein